MRITQKLVSASVLALLAGCSTLSSLNPWAAKKLNEPAALVELKGSMAVRTAWKLDIGKAETFMFTPAVVGATIVAAGAGGDIARIDAVTGRQIWRVKAPTTLSAGVGTDGNMVVVGGDEGSVHAFDMDGKFLWSASASSEVLSSPVIGEGMVVVRTADNRIIGLDAKTGTRKWTVQRISPPLTLRSAPGMVVVGKDVIIAQPGGKLLSVTIATGATRWEVAVAEPRGATELERVTDIAGNPVLFEGDVCAVAYQGKVGCFDMSTGTARWSKKFSSDTGVSVDQRFVFAVEDNGAVSAFARDTGANAWRNDKLSYRRLSTPVSYGRAVAVGDYQGIIHFLSREDGAFLARAATDGSPIISTPLVSGTNLIFQTQSGTVTAIAVE